MRGTILGYFGSGGTEGCMGQNERGERKVRGMSGVGEKLLVGEVYDFVCIHC